VTAPVPPGEIMEYLLPNIFRQFWSCVCVWGTWSNAPS